LDKTLVIPPSPRESLVKNFLRLTLVVQPVAQSLHPMSYPCFY